MSEHAHRCKSNASEALWKLRSSAILDEGKYHPVHESGKSEVEKSLSEIIHEKERLAFRGKKIHLS